MADVPRNDEAALLQSSEFALGGPGSRSCHSNQFGRVKAAVRFPKEHPEDALLRL
jgi:hypothetical protein